MAQAKSGDTVQVHYTGTLTDGTVFDSSVDRDPLEFKLGEGRVIPGFEMGVMGMEQGAKKTVEIPPENAYGSHQPELMLKVGRDQFPPDVTPEVGMQLQIQHGNGQMSNVTIAEVMDTEVVLDANHPLAGETLIFELELMAIL